VPAELKDAADLILDAGQVAGTPSTVLDFTTTPPCILRPGAISRDRIVQLIGPTLATN